MNALIADIGGTHSRLAIASSIGDVSRPMRYENSRYESLDAVLADYLSAHDIRPEIAVLAVAGPVVSDRVNLTNLGWQIDAGSLRREHNFSHLELMNDFTALAWATQFAAPEDLTPIGGGHLCSSATLGVIGPGTGLGAGGLVLSEHGWAIVSGEGGHVSLAPATEQEYALIRKVQAERGHCSAEYLLSGPGLLRIHHFLGGAAGRPREVTEQLRQGNETAKQSFELFCGLLGDFAANFALSLGARGGIYIAGGILPGMIDLFSRTSFRERFESKGRMSAYLSNIATVVMTGEEPALQGLAGYVSSRYKPV